MPFLMISVTTGLLKPSSKCFSRAFQVVFSDKPPTHTLQVGSRFLSFSATLGSVFFFAEGACAVFPAFFLVLVFLGFVSSFSPFTQASTSIVSPSSSDPLSVAIAVSASSAVLNATTPVPFFSDMSVTLGLATLSKCFSSAFHVTFLLRPPTQTLQELSTFCSFSMVFFLSISFLLSVFPGIDIPLPQGIDIICGIPPLGTNIH
mmetsp:Transcript_72510/g.136989  ORF Transcript_72510/g.136989 Transcript_72510/m.136989 type:complete len:204 (-) Transcript_72510:159-770(-)